MEESPTVAPPEIPGQKYVKPGTSNAKIATILATLHTVAKEERLLLSLLPGMLPWRTGKVKKTPWWRHLLSAASLPATGLRHSTPSALRTDHHSPGWVGHHHCLGPRNHSWHRGRLLTSQDTVFIRNLHLCSFQSPNTQNSCSQVTQPTHLHLTSHASCPR